MCTKEQQKSIFFTRSSYFFLTLCLFARDAEDRLDQNQKTAMEREHILQTYQNCYKSLKIELIEQSKQGKR